MAELLHLTEESPDHKAWGIYRRSNRAPAGRPLGLQVMCLNYTKAKEQATALTASFPDYHYAVCGAATAAVLPDTYTPAPCPLPKP